MPTEQSPTASDIPPHVRQAAAATREHDECDVRRRLLLDYLSVFHERCPSCKYELHRLTSERCPECGESLRLRVGLESPNTGASVIGLIGISCGLGFSGLLVLYAAVLWLIEGNFGPGLSPVIVLSIETAVMMGLLLLWIRASGRLRRAAPVVRWSMGVACCALPFLNLIIFLVWLD